MEGVEFGWSLETSSLFLWLSICGRSQCSRAGPAGRALCPGTALGQPGVGQKPGQASPVEGKDMVEHPNMPMGTSLVMGGMVSDTELPAHANP